MCTVLYVGNFGTLVQALVSGLQPLSNCDFIEWCVRPQQGVRCVRAQAARPYHMISHLMLEGTMERGGGSCTTTMMTTCT